jgi:hypothetical protein
MRRYNRRMLRLPARSVVGLALASQLLGCRGTPPARDTYPPEHPVELAAPPTASATPPPALAVSAASDECAPDAEPAARAGPSGERPFVEFLPEEEVALTRSKPTTPVRFGKVVCKANEEVWRDAEGRVRVCTVAMRTTVEGIDIAADAYTHFHATGRAHQTHLARPQTLETAKSQPIACGKDLVVLSKTGALEHCKLNKPVTLGEVACRKGESVSFHPGGELSMAVIDRPYTSLGTEFPAGARLSFHPSGALAGGWLHEPLRVLGVLVRWDFFVYPSGKLHAFELAEKRSFQGHDFPERAKIELREDGSLRRAEYEVDSGFMPHGEMWKDTKHVRFDCHGTVLSENVDHWQADRPPPSMRRKHW